MEKYAVCVYLLILSIFDLKKKRVPLFLLVAGVLVAGLIVIYWSLTGRSTWGQVILGMIPGTLLLALAYLSGKAGYADGIVLMIVGMVKHYQAGLFILGASLFGVSLVSILLLLLRKVRKDTKIPYIPFLTAAFCIKEFLMI